MLDTNILQKLHKTGLKNICRLCLTEGPPFRDIYSAKILDMIQCCSDIKISKSDNLPKQICVSCFHKMTKLFTFKRRIERVNKILKAFIKTKSKSRDIINIALEKSDIKEVETTFIENPFETPKLSEEDIPLRERSLKIKYLSAESQNKYLNPTQIKTENVMQTIQFQGSTQQAKLISYKYSFDLPPLVPLNQNSELKDCMLTDTSLGYETIPTVSLEKAMEDTILPPLVPINPLKVDLKLLENAVEAPNLKFSCSTCNEEFASANSLKDHKLKSCQINTLECSICKRQFHEKEKLISHLKGHKVSKDYLCTICGKRYLNPSTFRVHVRTHTGERPFKCDICNKGFVRWAGVKSHMNTHQNARPFKCETCGRGFKVSSNLQRHKLLHTGIYSFCCNYCGKTFSQSDHLKVHIRLYHTNEKPYLCSECGKRFVSLQRLKRHSWIHTGFKPHACILCPKAYSNSNDFKNHMLKVHSGKTGNKDEGKKYVCSQCNSRFRHPCRLSKHMKTHEGPEKKCLACGKTFKLLHALNKHLKSGKCGTYVINSSKANKVIDTLYKIDINSVY